MGDGPKLAVAILVMWIAMVFFFFAFHPGGVENVSNPGEMLQWLMNEFGNLIGGNTSTDAATSLTASETSALNYPGYTSTPDNGSSSTIVAGGGVQAV